MLSGNKLRQKAESSGSEVKIVRIEAESLKLFPSRPDSDSNFGEKTVSWSRSFETAASSLDFVYKKLRQTPENTPKTTK